MLIFWPHTRGQEGRGIIENRATGIVIGASTTCHHYLMPHRRCGEVREINGHFAASSQSPLAMHGDAPTCWPVTCRAETMMDQ